MPEEPTPARSSSFNFRLFLPLAGALAVLVVLIGTNQFGGSQSSSVAARKGFGDLSPITQNGGAGGGNGNQVMANNAPLTATEAGEAQDDSGNNPAPTADVDRAATSFAYGMGGGGAGTDAKIMIAPGGPFDEYLPPKVTYAWNGQLPEVSGELSVFRDKPLSVDKGLFKFLAKATKLPLFGRVSEGNLSNISFTVPGSPYQYNLDQSGRFNMWSQAFGRYEQTPPPQPADEEMIAIANDFLRGQGLDLSRYGQPYVDKSWRNYVAFSEKDARPADLSIWAPQDVTVHYPFEIDGKQVVGYNGQPDPGVSVNVNINTRQVSNVNGRWETDKDQSLYPVVDQTRIVEKALQGGLAPLWGWVDESSFTAEQNARRTKIDVALTESSVGLIQHYKYVEGSNNSETYWVPVYVFKGSYTDAQGNPQTYGTIVPAVEGAFFDEPPYHIMGRSFSAEPAPAVDSAVTLEAPVSEPAVAQ